MSAVAEGGGGLVDHADPEFVWNMKALAIAMHVTGQIDQRLGRKKRAVDFPQIRDALLGGMDHAVGIHGQRFDADLKRESEQWERARAS